MRKTVLVAIGLGVLLVAGCRSGASTATQATSVSAIEPTAPAASPTPVVSQTPLAMATASGPATCVAAPLDLPVLSGISEVSDQDHVEGNSDARITIIEYADFQ